MIAGPQSAELELLVVVSAPVAEVEDDDGMPVVVLPESVVEQSELVVEPASEVVGLDEAPAAGVVTPVVVVVVVVVEVLVGAGMPVGAGLVVPVEVEDGDAVPVGLVKLVLARLHGELVVVAPGGKMGGARN